MTITVYDEAFVAHFWERVDRAGDAGGCWLWLGALAGHDGRGHIRHAGRLQYVHRIALELATGQPIPEGLHALHTCDRPSCVRNDDQGTYPVNGVLFPRWGHLWLGTNADNVADKVAKGRHVGGWPIGERHHAAKLTVASAAEIRRRYAAGGVSQRALATELGVTQNAIWQVLSGKAWKAEAAS